MKTLLLSILFFLFLQPAFSQYLPLPQASARWSLESLSPDMNGSSTRGYVHEIKGDTIIDGMVYQKVYQKRTWKKAGGQSTNFDYPLQLMGAMRQDTAARKVYFRFLIDIIYGCLEPFYSIINTGEDLLLFDFDMNTGDTIYLGYANEPFPRIIGAIDSVQYNDGIYRKRYAVNNSWPDFYFIEGLGTDVGLFAGIRGEFVEGNFCSLNCFKNNNEYIIGEGIYNCDSIDVEGQIPVVEVDRETTVKIFPNPFDASFQIDFQSSQTGEFHLRLHNSLGKLVKDEIILPNIMVTISTTNLVAGMYVASIWNGQQFLSGEQICKMP